MKVSLSILAVVSAAAIGRVSAQVPSRSIWRGISRCVDPQHPCAEEQVIYRLYASISDSTRWIMQGYKIVRADTIDMGPLELARDGPSQMLIGRLAAGTWTFDVRGDTLRGALELPDGRVMRRVRASRIPE